MVCIVGNSIRMDTKLGSYHILQFFVGAGLFLCICNQSSLQIQISLGSSGRNRIRPNLINLASKYEEEEEMDDLPNVGEATCNAVLDSIEDLVHPYIICITPIQFNFAIDWIYIIHFSQ